MNKFTEQNLLTNYMALIPCNYTELKPIYGAAKAVSYDVGSSLGVCDE